MCALLQIFFLQEPNKSQTILAASLLSDWQKIKFRLTCCQHLSARWPLIPPCSCNSLISCHNAIEICLYFSFFDTRVASLILHSNTELAEAVVEPHSVSTNPRRCALVGIAIPQKNQYYDVLSSLGRTSRAASDNVASRMLLLSVHEQQSLDSK